MTDPTPTRRSLDWDAVRDLVVVLVAIGLGIWFVLDDAPPDWLLRLSLAGALVAGLALALAALQRTIARR